MPYRIDLKGNLSARRETGDAELIKFRGTLLDGDPGPNPTAHSGRM